MKVRLLSHGPMKGKFNMAVDEGIRNAYLRGDVGPTLRFYRWKPACLSVGRFQNVGKQVDLENLRDLGIDSLGAPPAAGRCSTMTNSPTAWWFQRVAARVGAGDLYDIIPGAGGRAESLGIPASH